MALKTLRGSALPEGAVKLSKEEALELQKKFINNWPSDLDVQVFSLKYAPYLCAASTVFCGTIASNYFKKVFGVSVGLYTLAYIPSVLIPSLGSVIMTDRLLTDKILLMSMACPLCIQLKFTAFQMYNSALSPIALSFLFCHNYGSSPKAAGSYDSPFKEKISWSGISKIFKREQIRFQIIGLVQLGFSFFLPYLQNMQLENVMKKFEQSNFNEELPNDFV